MKTNNSALQSVLIGLLTVLALVGFSSTARADCTSTNWRDGVSDWFLPENWDPCVPDSTVDADINNGGTAVIDHQVNNEGAKAQFLILGHQEGDSGFVVVDGTHGGSLEVLPRPEVAKNGSIVVGGLGSGTLSITNGGTVRCGIAGIAGYNPSAKSHGAVKMTGANSRWVIAGNGESTGGSILSVCASVIGGQGCTALLDVRDGATIEVNNYVGNPVPDVRVNISGTVTGKAVFILSGGPENMEVRGTLSPVGEIIIAGKLELKPEATTMFSMTPQVWDSIQVKQEYQGRQGADWGHAALDGRLMVIMTGDFTPDTTFIILHADAGIYPDTKFQSESIKYSPSPGHCFIPVTTRDDANNVYIKIKSCG